MSENTAFFEDSADFWPKRQKKIPKVVQKKKTCKVSKNTLFCPGRTRPIFTENIPPCDKKISSASRKCLKNSLTDKPTNNQSCQASHAHNSGGGWFTDSSSGPVPLSHFGSAPPHLPPLKDLQGLKPSSFSPHPPLQHVAPTTSFSKAQFFVSNGPATTLET